MGIKIVMDDISLLKNSLDAINGLISEATFELAPDGLKLKAIDPTAAALTELHMLPTCFTQYDVDSPTKITLNIDYFLDVLKRAKQSDKVIIEFDGEDNILNIDMIGNMKRRFKFSLLENPENEQKVPNIQLDGAVIVDNKVLREAVKDCLMVSDHAIFHVTPDKFIISAVGDLNEVKHEITKDSPFLKEINFNEEHISRYSLDYLDKMVRGDKVGDDTKIRFKTDYVLEIEYKKKDMLSLKFILAPRVDND